MGFGILDLCQILQNRIVYQNPINCCCYSLLYFVHSYPALSDASKMTLQHQGGSMTSQEAETFESLPAFQGILRMRMWDERAKDPNIKIPAMDKYREMCREYLMETRGC